MSSLTIPIKASVTLRAFRASLSFSIAASTSGTIRHETPEQSVTQPQRCGAPPATGSASQSRSSSAWSTQPT